MPRTRRRMRRGGQNEGQNDTVSNFRRCSVRAVGVNKESSFGQRSKAKSFYKNREYSFGHKNDVITCKKSSYGHLETESGKTNDRVEQDSPVDDNCELPESFAVLEHTNVAQIKGTDTQMVINGDVDVTSEPMCRSGTKAGSNEQSNEQKIVGHRCAGKDSVDLLVKIGPNGSGAYIWVPGERFLRKDLMDRYFVDCDKMSSTDGRSVSRSVVVGSRTVTRRVSLA